jgi:hypothetical protein
MTYTVTELNNGQSVSMHVNDTLDVKLDLTPPILSYEGSATNTNLSEGVYDGTTIPGQASQSWVATATGNSQVSYQAMGTGNANIGSPLLFNITIS